MQPVLQLLVLIALKLVGDANSLPANNELNMEKIYERYGRKSNETWLSVHDDSYSEGRYSGWKKLFVCCGAEDDIERRLARYMDDGVVVVASEGPAGSADIAVAPPILDEVLQLLGAASFTVSVSDDDIETTIRRTFSRGRTSGLVTEKFFQLNEIEEHLKQLQQKYPDQAKLTIIGESVKKRPILQMSILSEGLRNKGEQPDNATATLPVLLLDAGMHAREWLSTATALHLIETLLEDHEATRGVEWRVVPVLNPDGYFYTWNKDRLWRKNRRPIASNRCVGVDLNRNFGVDFGGKGASQFPCSDEYHGTSAFSEPETRALRDAVNDAGERLKAYVSLHSYRQSILLPWAHSPKSHANAQNLTNMAHGIARAISELRGTKFEVDTAWFNLYPASGTSADWAADVDVPYSFIFELQDEGEHGFLWPESEIASAVNETYCGIKFMGKVIRKIFSPSEFLTQEDEDFSLVDVEMPADREPTTENGLALLLQIYEEVLTNQNQINNKNMAINLTVEQEPGLIKIKVSDDTATPTEEKPVGSLSISVKNKTHVDEQQAAGIVIQVRNPQAELPSHAVDVKASKSQIYERQPVQDTKDVNRSAAGEESSNSSSGKDDECADDVDCKVRNFIRNVLTSQRVTPAPNQQAPDE